jgi:hypothetical protein
MSISNDISDNILKYKKKIFIIGAGWYGCHISLYLLKKGYTITIGDKNTFFSGASSKNQNRLHLGFHYPRSESTIEESYKGYYKFIKRYPSLVENLDINLYFIHNKSVTQFSKYKEKFKINDDMLVNINSIPFKVNNTYEVCINTDEKYINNNNASKYFEKNLSLFYTHIDSINISYNNNDKIILNNNEYDYVINCTNNQFMPFNISKSTTYEAYCSLIYKINFDKITGITIMDGIFFSIYPYDIPNKLYTITHVKYGVISQSNDFTDICNIQNIDISKIKQLIEKDVFETLPDIINICEYKSYFISYKTKYDFITDDRSLKYFKSDKYISFSGGKITGIFEMESIIDSLI